MQANTVFLCLLLIFITVVSYLFIWPKVLRRWILSKPFPESWLAILKNRLPIYKNLSTDQQLELQNHIKLFVHNKQFIGCAGLDVTDEIKVTIASQASLLLLNRPTHEYAKLQFIYIYPTSFRATQKVRDELGLVSTQTRDLLGESWDSGKVVLAWDNVEQGVRNFTDGYNVVLHEFAHQLDQESGSANGAPLLYTKAAYKSWAYVFGKEFEALKNSDPTKASLIDRYGATNAAEFFAVATETFFEEPHKLYQNHHALFEELSRYYHLDPREWVN